MRALLLAATLLFAAAIPIKEFDASLRIPSEDGFSAAAVIYSARRIHEVRFPDTSCFVQGITLCDIWGTGPVLFESCGLKGKSALQQRDLDSAEVIKRTPLPGRLFGEGVALVRGFAFQLTYKARALLVFNASSLAFVRSFAYPSPIAEGWGLASNGSSLIVSDGTSVLRVWAVAFSPSGRPSAVTEAGVVRIALPRRGRTRSAAAAAVTGAPMLSPAARRPLQAGSPMDSGVLGVLQKLAMPSADGSAAYEDAAAAFGAVGPSVSLLPGGSGPDGKGGLRGVNDLEFIPHDAASWSSPGPTADANIPRGHVLANVFGSPCLAIIDLPSGDVRGWIVAEGLYRDNPNPDTQVMNGVAFDPVSGHLFLTGKNWPVVYEVDIVPQPGRDPTMVETSLCTPRFFGNNRYLALRGIIAGADPNK